MALVVAYLLAFGLGIFASVAALRGADLSIPSSADGGPVSYDWTYVTVEICLTMIAVGLVVGAAELTAGGGFRWPGGDIAHRTSPVGPVVIVATIAVYALALVSAQLIQQAMLAHGAGLPAPETRAGTPVSAAMILAAHAGIGEEMIVVAGLAMAVGLFTRRAVIALPILIAARLAYHVYYGWAVAALVLWAAVSAYIIWRWRSWTILTGFIALHIAWDALIHWDLWANGYAILYLFGVPAVAVLVACFIVDRRWWAAPSASSEPELGRVRTSPISAP
ncbi:MULTISPECIES: hypothetical protein [Gordonia]|uniref:hypothetical protein n=1 Tax=Gordonia TaxID=2053 RepID=UPI0007EB0410|nr:MULTISPECIES: hypothetical protein [Gordonia]OBC06981.1 hypothetical protein A5785_08985 [Gordonia sp. 852002-50395_SCH5434458]OBC17869.1 hypothetical protein A5786_17935 [Gordonia sp. 852002-50816_SCH5313054-a]OBC18267.1 hypothetical protein A5788_10700 [Gordonia sp. 852002-50816_SCH5313054-c]